MPTLNFDNVNGTLSVKVPAVFPAGIHLELKPTEEGVILDLWDGKAECFTWTQAIPYAEMLNEEQIEREEDEAGADNQAVAETPNDASSNDPLTAIADAIDDDLNAAASLPESIAWYVIDRLRSAGLLRDGV